MASTDENGTVYIAIVNLGLNDVETAGADAALSQKVTLAVNGMDLTGKTLKIKTLAGDSFYQENDLANLRTWRLRSAPRRQRVPRMSLSSPRTPSRSWPLVMAPRSRRWIPIRSPSPNRRSTRSSSCSMASRTRPLMWWTASSPRSFPCSLARDGFLRLVL